MRGFARALLEDHAGQLDATGVDYLHRVVQGAARLDRQIEDVLTYSRMVKTELPLDRVDVQRLLRNMLDTNPALQTFRDQIVLELPLPAVTGNPAALTQVFANLLSNAVKFVAPDRPPQVRVSAEWRDDRVRFWVSDNGIGIPAHARTKLFRLFQQLHAADHYDGTGVGLAIVRKAAERMGGTVGVESEENVGSRFWVELSPAPPVSAPEPSAQILPPVSTLAAPILKPFPPASPATAP
jgi:signal transduction histidine kinase